MLLPGHIIWPFVFSQPHRIHLFNTNSPFSSGQFMSFISKYSSKQLLLWILPSIKLTPKWSISTCYSGLEDYGSYYKFNNSLNVLAKYWELVFDVAMNRLSSRLRQTWRPALPLAISWLWSLTEIVQHLLLHNKELMMSSFQDHGILNTGQEKLAQHLTHGRAAWHQPGHLVRGTSTEKTPTTHRPVGRSVRYFLD